MNNEDKMDMALMRFSAIAPLVNGTTLAESINAYCRAAAKRKYTLPNGERKQYSPNSISRWYYTYTREGFDGLVSQKRKDEGQSRALDEDTKEAIRYLKKTYPKMPLYVLREYQHTGIGKQAFAILKDYCQEKGINRFACDCSPHNENAMQFYQRMGGVVTKTDTGHENKQEDGVIFEFNL